MAIVIPCHRMIGSDGSLTGYGGGLPRKLWLLGHEGAIPLATDARCAPERGDRDARPISARRRPPCIPIRPSG